MVAAFTGCAGTGPAKDAAGGTSGDVPAQRRAVELLEQDAGRKGNVWIRCTPAEAVILLEGVPQGTCGMLVEAGRGLTVTDRRLHRLEVKHRGFHPYVTYVAPGGTRATLQVTLRPLAGQEKAP
ncbi:MAG TPA: hypothetical protein VK013_02845 [Myxococcaceae bacterium]|nr:hypothetical protein [Myxococcaceae bacterium]